MIIGILAALLATILPGSTAHAEHRDPAEPRHSAARITDAGAARSGELSNGCRISRRGVPACGVLVGAAHGSNTSPRRLEEKLGRQLGIRRTYFTAGSVDSAVRTARVDLAAGRVPWISFKLPHSWADMVDGRGDAWARSLAARFARVDGPVWLAFHHEPETDGSMGDWRRMQERLIPIVRRTAPNVAYTVVVTGWHQFYGEREYSLANIWPRRGKVDIAGFDIYQQYGVVKDGRTTRDWTDFSEYFAKIRAWAKRQDVAWGLAETGVTDTAARRRPTEIADTVSLMRQYGGVGYAYFDTTLNSIAPWTLGTREKISSFRRALNHSPSLQR